MINKILAIIKYTFKESIRNKVFYILILFAVILLLSSLFFGVLGGEQELRLLHDFGLVTIEFFCLLTAIYSGITIILEEINSKTIYFIITRSVKRSSYILGRYLGVIYTIIVGVLLMTILHLLILLLKGYSIDLNYFLSFLGLIIKIMVILAISIFFALFSTSAVSSLSFTLLFWLLGHFGQEMKFLMNKITNIIPKLFLQLIYYIIPNLQYFNYRDNVLLAINSTPLFFISSIIYATVYISVCLWLTIILFNKKEF